MNILFVTPYYTSTSAGGIESQVQTFAQALSAEHHCVVIGPAAGKDEMVLEQHITVYRTQLVNPHAGVTPQQNACVAFFQKVIQQEQIDTIIAHNLHVWVHPAVPTALVTIAEDNHIPVYLRIHNFCYPSEGVYLRSLPWRRFLCVSQRLAEQIATFDISPNQIAVLYPPIDTDLFFPKPNTYLQDTLPIPRDAVIVLHASRLVGGPTVFQSKGFLSLLQIFSRLKNGHLVFCVAQPPATHQREFAQHQQTIQDMATSLSLSARVHLISASYAEMPTIYNSAHIFVLLSQLEAFGRVYAEASACGLPVIGARAGGVPEAIAHGATGFVVSTAQDAQNHLAQLIADAELRTNLGQAGTAYVRERFALAVIKPTLLQLLRQA